MSNYLKPSVHQGNHAAAFVVRGLYGLTAGERTSVNTAGIRVSGEARRARSSAVIATRVNERAVAAVAPEASGNHVAIEAMDSRSQLFGQQKTQLFTMWALRGLDPWSSAQT